MELSSNPTHLAEQIVLGNVLDRGLSATTVFDAVPPESFHGPNLLVAEALYALVQREAQIDPVALLAECRARGVLGRLANGAYIHTLVEAATSPVGNHLDYLADRVLLNRLTLLSSQIERAVAQPDADPRAIQVVLEERLASLGVASDNGATTDPNIEAILEETDRPVDWIVPDLLARGDRFLLTGPEGFGKSTLTRQFALALACGLHPFLQTAIPQRRVWMLDMENTRDETGRAMRWMHSRLRLPIAPGQIPLRIEFRIRGINVGSPSDASWLTRQVRAFAPDLIVVTPLYKLHRLDITDEPAARTVVDVLDGLREATGAALLVEAHSPLAQDVNGARVMRPYGSSVFIRWPEFGRGLRPGKESTPAMRLATLERFRGDRVTRNIPEQLCSGDPLPWIVDPREDPR